jgi:hypothetical protein
MKHIFIQSIVVIALLIGLGQPVQAYDIESMLFDNTSIRLYESVIEANRRQAVYSYIIANASTPEIDLVALLLPDDRIQFQRKVPAGEEDSGLVMEFVMAKVGENTKRQNAYILMMKKKFDMLKTVISKGQK